MTFERVDRLAKLYLEYLDAAGERGYVIGAAWKKQAARKLGVHNSAVGELLRRIESWWGRPLFDVAEGPISAYNITTLNEHGFIVLDDMLRIAGGWDPGKPYYALMDNIRDRVEVFRGWNEVERVDSGESPALLMSDLVLTWQVGRGASFGELSRLADTPQKIYSAVGRVERYFGVRFIKRPTSTNTPNWTEVGLVCQPEFEEIARRWQRLLMLRRKS
jgi:hypothetical protein